MSAENIKAAVRRLWEMEDFRGVSRLDIEPGITRLREEIFLPEFVLHAGEIDFALDRYLQLWGARLIAFPDQMGKVEDIVAEGNNVAARVFLQGTHHGEFMGMQPTGKVLEQELFVFVHFRDGKFAEAWGCHQGGQDILQHLKTVLPGKD